MFQISLRDNRKMSTIKIEIVFFFLLNHAKLAGYFQLIFYTKLAIYPGAKLA